MVENATLECFLMSKEAADEGNCPSPGVMFPMTGESPILSGMGTSREFREGCGPKNTYLKRINRDPTSMASAAALTQLQ